MDNFKVHLADLDGMPETECIVCGNSLRNSEDYKRAAIMQFTYEQNKHTDYMCQECLLLGAEGRETIVDVRMLLLKNVHITLRNYDSQLKKRRLELIGEGYCD